MKLLTNELEGKYPNFLDTEIIRVIENYPSRLSPLQLLLLGKSIFDILMYEVWGSE